jgi:hypothetical protein
MDETSAIASSHRHKGPDSGRAQGRLPAVPDSPHRTASDNGVADVIAGLDALASELSVHGWVAHVRTSPGRMASLRACNPEPGAAALSEDIYAKPGSGGGWEYWWPWAEKIAADPASAAAVIVHVLRPAQPR